MLRGRLSRFALLLRSRTEPGCLMLRSWLCICLRSTCVTVVCEPGSLRHITRHAKLFFFCLTYESLDHTHGQKVLELLMGISPLRERCSKSTGLLKHWCECQSMRIRREEMYLLRTGNSNAFEEYRCETSVPGDRY